MAALDAAIHARPLSCSEFKLLIYLAVFLSYY